MRETPVHGRGKQDKYSTIVLICQEDERHFMLMHVDHEVGAFRNEGTAGKRLEQSVRKSTIIEIPDQRKNIRYLYYSVKTGIKNTQPRGEKKLSVSKNNWLTI